MNKTLVGGKEKGENNTPGASLLFPTTTDEKLGEELQRSYAWDAEGKV